MTRQSSSAADGTRFGPSKPPLKLVPTLTSGLVMGFLEIAMAVSLAALIFSGPLVEFRSLAIGLALLGALLSNAVVSLFTSLPGVMGGNQELPAVLIALIVGNIVAGASNLTRPESLLITVLAAIALTTLITGVTFLTLGTFRLGNLVRFLPYPVIGGFLAGTGWLLTNGALLTMVPTLNLFIIMQPEMLLRWLPGVVMGLVLLLWTRRSDNYLIVPFVLVVSISLFYIVAWWVGLSLDQLQQQGWLLGPFAEGSLWRPFPVGDLPMVQWHLLLAESADIAVVVLVSVMGLLLNAGGIELAADEDMDLNNELRSAGWGNLLSGFVSGLIGYQQISLSVMNFKLQANNRWTGMVGSVICLLALLFGAALLSLLPQMVIGGLLLYLGLEFLVEWVLESRSRLPRIDYAIIISILLVTAFVGFLQGVALGLVLAVILFVAGYSRIDVVRHELSGATYRSRTTRPQREEQFLLQHGAGLVIYQLQGFIFFGTADQLLSRVRQRISDPRLPSPRIITLDFSRVTGLDSTGLLSFQRMFQLTQACGAKLVFINPPDKMDQQLLRGGIGPAGGDIHTFTSLDRGVQWGEDLLLQSAAAGHDLDNPPINEFLGQILGSAQDVHALLSYFEKLDVRTGQHLITLGQTAHDLYIIESGQVTVQIPRPDQPPVRLETIGSGHVIGEIGLYLNQERTADVVVDQPGVVFRLSKEKMQHMEDNDAHAASVLHRLMVRILAERITRLTTVFNSLQE